MARLVSVQRGPVVTEVLKELELLGHDLTITPDARSALDAVSAGADVLLVDWSMEDMSAADVMRELEERMLRAGTRVLLLSSRITEAEIAAAYEVGVDRVVPDSSSAQELDAALTDVLLATQDALDEARRTEGRRARLLAELGETCDEDDDYER